MLLLDTGMTIEKAGGDTDALWFVVRGLGGFKMQHVQTCCEHVYLDDIAGDMSDLLGHPLLLCEEVTNQEDINGGDYVKSQTWTFYKFSTIRGSITLRWYGSSSGFYSEKVDMAEVPVEEAEAAIASAKWKWGC